MQSNQMVWASIYIHFQARFEKNSAAVLFQVSLKYFYYSYISSHFAEMFV